jgi:hypothetical protein
MWFVGLILVGLGLVVVRWIIQTAVEDGVTKALRRHHLWLLDQQDGDSN